MQFQGTVVASKKLRGARKELEMELSVTGWTTATTWLWGLGLAQKLSGPNHVSSGDALGLGSGSHSLAAPQGRTQQAEIFPEELSFMCWNLYSESRGVALGFPVLCSLEIRVSGLGLIVAEFEVEFQAKDAEFER